MPASAAHRGDLPGPGEPLAEVVRGGFVESVHLGHLVLLDGDGTELLRRGRPDGTFFARSSLKPLQAVGMLRAGLDLRDGELALACASHSGEPRHVEVARAVLAGAGLDEASLRNTPDLPLGPAASLAWQRAGGTAAAVTQNCSGKHAAMLATCVAARWPTETYLDPEHPLQRAVRAAVEDLTGERVAVVSVDGCGAPLFSCSLTGLARAFARIATAPPASPEGRVAAAMRAHPGLVGGTGRDVTLAMEAVPGLVAKDGAEGVYAAALPDGAALAFKVSDGSGRARPPVLGAALRLAGVPASQVAGWSEVPVLGHGHPVGEVRPWSSPAQDAS
ncbi:asparaginase [Georgenia wangjunii]|uniref:asparaginase n=1 Tax=Georgenia wangjunii TaxID=3117730 RepID=UPI003D9C5916